MGETRFSPGEWRIRPRASVWDPVVIETDDETICRVMENGEANAPLLAAAKRLYEAACAVLACQRCSDDYGRCLRCEETLKAALAKAEGRTR